MKSLTKLLRKKNQIPYIIRYYTSSIKLSDESRRHFPKHNFKLGIQDACFELGQPKHGVAQGPEYLRRTGFIQVLQEVVKIDVKDYGKIPLKNLVNGYTLDAQLKLSSLETHIIKGKPEVQVEVRNVPETSEATKIISKSTVNILKENRFCLTLGGDHSVAIGTIHGISSIFPDIGIIWIDGHSDINTKQTTATGNIHGMPISFLIQEMQNYREIIPEFSWINAKIPAKNLVYIGLRDVEPYEKNYLDLLGLKYYSMAHVDQLGINAVIDGAIAHLTDKFPNRPIHVSFDVDALDDLEIPCTGTAVPGGLTLREGMHVVETIFSSTNFISMDLVEFNPKLGTELELQRSCKALKEILFSSFGYDRSGMPVLDPDRKPIVPMPKKSISSIR